MRHPRADRDSRVAWSERRAAPGRRAPRLREAVGPNGRDLEPRRVPSRCSRSSPVPRRKPARHRRVPPLLLPAEHSDLPVLRPVLVTNERPHQGTYDPAMGDRDHRAVAWRSPVHVLEPPHDPTGEVVQPLASRGGSPTPMLLPRDEPVSEAPEVLVVRAAREHTEVQLTQPSVHARISTESDARRRNGPPEIARPQVESRDAGATQPSTDRPGGLAARSGQVRILPSLIETCPVPGGLAVAHEDQPHGRRKESEGVGDRETGRPGAGIRAFKAVMSRRFCSGRRAPIRKYPGIPKEPHRRTRSPSASRAVARASAATPDESSRLPAPAWTV